MAADWYDWTMGDNPPDYVLVEVLYGEEVHRAKAIWGRDGVRPHWELENGGLCGTTTFHKWRPIKETQNESV